MSNMVIYMTRVMRYEPAFASVQLMLFEGTCYLTPILGAWLADSRWGRFKCILIFSIIYFVVGTGPCLCT
jgi:peptide/histidine transporter 3/4